MKDDFHFFLTDVTINVNVYFIRGRKLRLMVETSVTFRGEGEGNQAMNEIMEGRKLVGERAGERSMDKSGRWHK